MPKDGELLCRHGSTGGFPAFAGFDPVAGVGLVAAGNTLTTNRRRFVRGAHTTLCALRHS
ncbi:hypothetical protein [Kitasatospora sp. DSM 101779]|uniref:hypothetical protein n=1 Tax=Kitasatospora sp. DSM 101779 TaxID=2853165 RepID=UPI0021D9A6E7|nr:hypothetical protein [Kitasatospora sp. DSM 101779]MCU7823962.1 hypothetical protein [Kitasatospora sp. DSM 101779]